MLFITYIIKNLINCQPTNQKLYIYIYMSVTMKSTTKCKIKPIHSMIDTRRRGRIGNG